MTVQINYKNSGSKKNSSNLILFVDEKFNISGLKKHISDTEFSYISDLIKNSEDIMRLKKIGVLGHSLGGMASIGAYSKGAESDFLIQVCFLFGSADSFYIYWSSSDDVTLICL